MMAKDIYTSKGEEPKLSEVMDDPIIRLIMKSDGVSLGALLPLIEEISLKVAKQESAA